MSNSPGLTLPSGRYRRLPRIGRVAVCAAVPVAIAVFAIGVSGALADPHDGPGPGRPEPGSLIERNAERLGLDAKTSKDIRGIVGDARKRGDKIDEKMRKERQKLGEMLRADEPDEAAIMKQVDRIGELEVDERKNRLRAMLEIRGKLTPEQREKLIELRKEAYGDWRERAGAGPGHGPGGAAPGRPPGHGGGKPPDRSGPPPSEP